MKKFLLLIVMCVFASSFAFGANAEDAGPKLVQVYIEMNDATMASSNDYVGWCTVTVVDENGKPIVGASVIIVDENGIPLGGANGTITNNNGDATINLPSDGNNLWLLISFIGYESQIIPANVHYNYVWLWPDDI